MSTPAPRSLRWRLPLIGLFVLVTAVLALVPSLLPSLGTSQRDTLQGMAAGAACSLALLLLVLAVPAARRAYFQLVEAREHGGLRDKRVAWLSWTAVALYVATLAMALYSTAMVLHLRQLDELMRKIEMESWALSALVVSQAYFATWVLLKAGLVHVDTGNALLWLGVWLLIVRTGFYVWLMRRYL